MLISIKNYHGAKTNLVFGNWVKNRITILNHKNQVCVIRNSNFFLFISIKKTNFMVSYNILSGGKFSLVFLFK